MGKILQKRLKQDSFPAVENEAILNLLVTSYYLRKDLNDLYAGYGLTMGQYNVLRILKGAHPEGHARCDIIDRMIEPAPDVTRLVDRLEEAGYVERHRSEEDARRSIAKITKNGLEKLEELHDDVDTYNKSFGDYLNKEECQTLSKLCEKIYAERID